MNAFKNYCETIEFSQFNLTNLDVHNMNLLGNAIVQICTPVMYTIRDIHKRYCIEVWKYEPGSSGSVIKIGDIYTVHTPTTGTSRYELKEIHSVIRYIAVYPEPQKPKEPKKSKREPKSKEKPWL